MPKHHKTIFICSCKVNINSIPKPTYTHKHTHICSSTHFSQQTQKRNHIIVFGKEKWNRNSGDHDNKGSNNLNHFMTLNEMEMVWLRNEFFHPYNNNSVTCKTSFIAFANLFKPHTALHHYMMHDWTEEDFNYIAMIYLWGPQTTIINWRLKTFELKTKDCVDKMTYVITFFLIVEYIL